MSLEDSETLPQDSIELGDKLCIVPPGYMNDITPWLHIANRGKMRQGYYVQRIPPNPLTKPPEDEHLIIYLVPISRSEELVPK